MTASFQAKIQTWDFPYTNHHTMTFGWSCIWMEKRVWPSGKV